MYFYKTQKKTYQVCMRFYTNLYVNKKTKLKGVQYNILYKTKKLTKIY